ncbi:HXXEE domain-containing protein [Nesterenkonia ebinurensis]|uniref:HXXEE domain-containing protein n=1 Tax=Nesterenkonia ebinurensis TaxID=2608252 RepID=UPI00123CBB2F|nr:HXXEE domain-containing protein [Nesterenkonia ebinurensis]
MTRPEQPYPRKRRGPILLFLSWVLHDVEEAATFPATCDYLADRTGFESLRMNSRQSWAAVGLMGTLVGFACVRGARTEGRSQLYRAVTAGLEGHVFTHLAASAVTRRYTAGVVSALPVMLPGTRAASQELSRDNRPLTTKDRALGSAVLIPAALACHLIVRTIMKR